MCVLLLLVILKHGYYIVFLSSRIVYHKSMILDEMQGQLVLSLIIYSNFWPAKTKNFFIGNNEMHIG